MQINVEGKDEMAIVVYKVLDEIDACCVGFLGCHLVKYWKQYDRLLAQVIDIYSERSQSPTAREKYTNQNGFCIGAIILILLKVDRLN